MEDNSQSWIMIPEEKELFRRGIDEFNDCRFFDCHETLEELWQGCRHQDRELIQGLIQIAVAYHHLLRDNRAGCKKLLSRGILRVERFEPVAHGLRLDLFLVDVRKTYLELDKPSGSGPACGNSEKNDKEPLIPRITRITCNDNK